VIVEIAGPAGAGKSSLLLALRRRDRTIVALSSFRGPIGYLPIWIGTAIWKLPGLLREGRIVPGLGGKELRLMVHLMSMHHLLERACSPKRPIAVLDQGPLYMLTRLWCCGLETAEGRTIVTWWHEMLRSWAARLQLVVWLDAPTPVLMERIRRRAKWHLIKHESDEHATRFLATVRMGYERVMARVADDGGPKVLRFDTEARSLDEIATQVLAAVRAAGAPSPRRGETPHSLEGTRVVPSAR
jgi:thymidylate kinase